MRRVITGLRQDEAGVWVAELSCFHRQHIHHEPPFWNAPWVLDEDERIQRVGTIIECRLCDRAELPDGLSPVRATPSWTERTLPAALQRHHRLAAGVWAVLRVEHGALRFVARTAPPIEAVLSPGDEQPIPPEVDHHVELVGPVRLHLEFLGPSDPTRPSTTTSSNQ